MAIPNFTILAWAFIGGVIPTFFWLWFWLRNDEHPEPRGLVTLAFIAGAVAVPIVIPIQTWLIPLFHDATLHMTSAALMEELVKFILIALLIFPTRHVDEPKDYVIYLVTGALGFAALENMLFLINPLTDNNTLLTITMGNLRFFGATVLHATSAAILGLSMGMVFYSNKTVRVFYATVGIIAATSLHALFNYFIMLGTQQSIFITIAVLWLVTIIIIFMFKKLKTLGRTTRRYTR